MTGEPDSWSTRFERAYNEPTNKRARARVSRDPWQQLKYERKQRAAAESSRLVKAARRAQRVSGRIKPRSGANGSTASEAATVSQREAAIVRRTKSVLAQMGRTVEAGGGLEATLPPLRSAIEEAGDRRELLWFAFLAITGRYPRESDLLLLESDLEVYGTDHAIEGLLAANARRREAWSLYADIRFVNDVVVDVSRTARTEAHTGIQRVVRETVSRWMVAHEVALAIWDARAGVLRGAQPDEQERITTYKPGPDTAKLASPDQNAAVILAPFRTTVIVPEPSSNLDRSLCLEAVEGWTPCDLAAVFYDFIGQVAPEVVGEHGRLQLSNYVPVLRGANRISAISETARQEVEGFGSSIVSLGMPPPTVRAHLLPGTPPLNVAPNPPPQLTELLAEDRGPLVVSVSRIEPRKNQIATLRAAESLWAEGLEFQLLFVGWSETKESTFDPEFQELQRRGRPVTVISRTSDDLLWNAYRQARFSVFVSLAEGYGLPAAESLAVGTPVVLSNYGSMAEIGAQGGVAPVDPRNVGEIMSAMRRLLTDDEHHAQLQAEARRRDSGNWDDYARTTWDWLVLARG